MQQETEAQRTRRELQEQLAQNTALMQKMYKHIDALRIKNNILHQHISKLIKS